MHQQGMMQTQGMMGQGTRHIHPLPASALPLFVDSFYYFSLGLNLIVFFVLVWFALPFLPFLPL